MRKILEFDVPETINDILQDQKQRDNYRHGWSEAFYIFSAEKDGDFINERERAARCYEAAKDGCNGKFHWECIEDFREFGSSLFAELRKQVETWIDGREEFDGDVVDEFFDRRHVERFNPATCRIETAAQYLGRVNQAILMQAKDKQ